MTQLQRRILDLVLEIDSICRENDIEYYMEGGSALGAMRHGGFLPWDDDADIAMTRDNWDKFAHVMTHNPPPGRGIESCELNPEYPTIAMRYVDLISTRLWRSWMCDDCASGLAIDIMVLENAPDDDELLEQMKQDLIDYNEFMYYHYRQSRLGSGERYKQLVQRSKIEGRQVVANEMNQRLLKYRDVECKRYLMRWGLRFQVYNKEVFGKPKYVPFEDTMLAVPERIAEYCAYQFGIDWYVMPEGEDAIVHDPIVLDLDISYRDYAKSYMPFVNKQDFVNLTLRKKELQMELLDQNKAYHRYMYGVAGEMTATTLEKKLTSMELDLETVFSEVNKESEALFQELFSDYLLKQLNQWYQYFGVYVPVDDDVLNCVCNFLIRCGELSKVEKLLELRLEQKKELKPAMQRTLEAFELVKHTLDLFWAGELSEAASLIDTAPEDLAKAPLQTAISLLNRMVNAGEDELAQLKEQAPQLITQFPKEDAFKLLYACVLYRLNYRASAGKLLRKLVEESRNGMIVRMILTDSRLAPLTADVTVI